MVLFQSLATSSKLIVAQIRLEPTGKDCDTRLGKSICLHIDFPNLVSKSIKSLQNEIMSMLIPHVGLLEFTTPNPRSIRLQWLMQSQNREELARFILLHLNFSKGFKSLLKSLPQSNNHYPGYDENHLNTLISPTNFS